MRQLPSKEKAAQVGLEMLNELVPFWLCLVHYHRLWWGTFFYHSGLLGILTARIRI